MGRKANVDKVAVEKVNASKNNAVIEDIKDTENIQVETNKEVSKTESEIQETKFVKKLRNQFPKDMDVVVKSAFNGVLVYKNPKTGYTIEFPCIGSEQEVTIDDIKIIKNSMPIFFKEGWLVIEDQNVIYDQSLEKYFQSVFSKETIEHLFSCKLDEFISGFSALTDGQKKSFLYAAIEGIENGELDSIKKIEYLESEFGVELIER